ncbi:MAG: fibronectin type III domain-containing protein, partial [Planctomycetota bacterium]
MKRLFFLLALASGIILPSEAVISIPGVDASGLTPLRFKVPPYLQFVSPESAVVFWETHQPGTAVLEYGTTNNLEKNVPDTTAKTKHQVTISGLEPDTVYSYRIKTFSGEIKSMSGIYEFDTAFNYTVSPVSQAIWPYPEDAMAKLYAKAAETIISETGKTKGYCLVYGCGRGQLAFELAKRSELMIICVDENADRVAETRKLLRQAGVYGKRITARYVESLAQL